MIMISLIRHSRDIIDNSLGLEVFLLILNPEGSVEIPALTCQILLSSMMPDPYTDKVQSSGLDKEPVGWGCWGVFGH